MLRWRFLNRILIVVRYVTRSLAVPFLLMSGSVGFPLQKET